MLTVYVLFLVFGVLPYAIALGAKIKLSWMYYKACHLADRVDWCSDARRQREEIWEAERKWWIIFVIALLISYISLVSLLIWGKYFS